MSANNQLLIEKIKGKFRVSDVDIEGSGGYFITDKLFNTLEEAIKAANEFQNTHEVEYGLEIKI